MPSTAPFDPEAALRALGRALPSAPGEANPIRVVGTLLYTGAVPPLGEGRIRYRGIVGSTLTTREGIMAAELCVLNLLSLIRAKTGSLDQVAQIERLAAFVRCTPAFGNPGRVLNSASRLLFQIFGEQGRHARLVFAAPDLLDGPAVEISAIVRLRMARFLPEQAA
jgi:hypothetical protein